MRQKNFLLTPETVYYNVVNLLRLVAPTIEPSTTTDGVMEQLDNLVILLDLEINKYAEDYSDVVIPVSKPLS